VRAQEISVSLVEDLDFCAESSDGCIEHRWRPGWLTEVFRTHTNTNNPVPKSPGRQHWVWVAAPWRPHAWVGVPRTSEDILTIQVAE